MIVYRLSFDQIKACSFYVISSLCQKSNCVHPLIRQKTVGFMNYEVDPEVDHILPESDLET